MSRRDLTKLLGMASLWVAGGYAVMKFTGKGIEPKLPVQTRRVEIIDASEPISEVKLATMMEVIAYSIDHEWAAGDEIRLMALNVEQPDQMLRDPIKQLFMSRVPETTLSEDEKIKSGQRAVEAAQAHYQEALVEPFWAAFKQGWAVAGDQTWSPILEATHAASGITRQAPPAANGNYVRLWSDMAQNSPVWSVYQGALYERQDELIKQYGETLDFGGDTTFDVRMILRPEYPDLQDDRLRSLLERFFQSAGANVVINHV